MNARLRITSPGLLLAACLVALPLTASADFFDDLDRVDEALRSNPSNVLQQSLQSCKKQRGYAVKLYEMGMTARAERALDYCYESLRISRDDPRTRVTAPSQDELLAKAQREYDLAMAMEADLVNGLKIYRECAACHEPEGWGRTSGSIPQIAGQHDSVIIRQLADFRAGNRDSAMMIPYATAETIGGPQGLADVAAYIGSLEISVENGKGPGTSLDLGEKLYGEHCADCHGASGEGDIENVVPRIQAQHFRYLQRQYEWIRDGKRRNANPEMVEQIQDFSDAEVEAILDYVSRLEPPPELQAPPGWKNPDFKQP